MTERELLDRVAAWLAEFEGMEHTHPRWTDEEQEPDVCATCYGGLLLADLEQELADLDAPKPLPLVEVLANFELGEE